MGKFLSLICILVFYANGYCFDFSKVDALINNGITKKYFPGAALVVGYKNDIIYEKYYGRFTYDEKDILKLLQLRRL
jgi:hypothetical protein